MKGNLPVINYDGYDPGFDLEPILDKCPMECLVFVGKPSDGALVAGPEESRNRWTTTPVFDGPLQNASV
jgi:hypothetical protein